MREPTDALRSLRKYVHMILGDEWRVALAYEEGVFKRPFARVGGLPDVTISGQRPDRYTLTESFNVLCHPKEAGTAQEAVLNAEALRSQLLHGFQRGAGAPLGPLTPPTAELAAGDLAIDDYSYRITAKTRSTESIAGPAVEVIAGGGTGVALTWDPVPGAGVYRVYRGDPGAERLLAEVDGLAFLDDGSRNLGSRVAPSVAVGTLGKPDRVPLWDWDGVPITQTSIDHELPEFMDVRSLSIGIAADPRDDARLAVAADIRMEWAAVGAVSSAANTLLGIRTRLTTT